MTEPSVLLEVFAFVGAMMVVPVITIVTMLLIIGRK